MAALYELEAAVSRCITYSDDNYVDTESGEILDLKAFEALKLERDVKREQVALYIKNKRAWAQALKYEAEALAARAQACEREAKRIFDYLAEMLDGEKFETPRVKITWRKSEAVDITDAALIPEAFSRVKVEPNKTAIKAALKAGEAVPGATLVTRNNMGVK